MSEMMPERSEWLPGTFVTMLWWRRCSQDVKAGIRTVETWYDFKREFKRQFYPENSQEIALKKRSTLKQTGTLSEYIKTYNSLMLEIEEMSDACRLLYFMDGLQRWAEQELKRRKPQTLAEAITVAESLTEIPRDAQKKRPFKEKGGGDRGSKHTRRKSGDASKTQNDGQLLLTLLRLAMRIKLSRS